MKVMVVKQFEFEAAHFLPDYDGTCGRTHGHSYRLEIGVSGQVDKETGMVMDFSRLKAIVKQDIVNVLDHSFLNELKSEIGFPWEMPTAENMVLWILQKLQNRWQGCKEDGIIAFIRLWETSTSYAEWRMGK